ncbi:MAG TPA: FAD-dependent monooxygenase [Steroidobacteraceae bacterium]|nr:FAD-dependent monooxygenase [Steroidobacteraceae bacterium]
MQSHFDAIIAGAGPAGASAAILLARAGWSIALIEKLAFPRRKVCGECIAATNLELLDALGIGDAVAAGSGSDLRRVALMQGRSTTIADLPQFDHSHHTWGKALGRETLDALLVAQARAVGVVVLQPWSVHSVDGVAGAYRCMLRASGSHDEALLHAPIVIAACGSWGRLSASRALKPRSRRSGDLFAFKANFRHATLPEDLLPVLSFDGGYGGMVLAGRGVATLACCVRADRVTRLRRTAPEKSAGEVVEAMLRRECAGVDAALRGARRVGNWLASGPLQLGIHLRRSDDLLRIGNAAGEAHPIIGEGLSMAIQSAWLLCAHLLRASARHDGLPDRRQLRVVRDRYASDWRRHFTRRLHVAAVLAHLAMHPRFSARLVPLLGRRAALLGRAARWGGKVRCVPDPATIAWLVAHQSRQEISAT